MQTRALRFRPRNERELRKVLELAVKQKKRVRAVGAGHSHSNAARPKDMFVELNAFEGVTESIRFLRAKPPRLGEGESLIQVRGGTMLKTLNRLYLTEKLKRSKGLINMGSFDGQTVAGAVNTATHGSGLESGSLADTILSVDLATTERVGSEVKVRLIRVEPSGGVTDPLAFARGAKVHGIDELIQNNALFRSVVAGYGCMGIAYSYIMVVRNEYWIQEMPRAITWSRLRAQRGSLVRNNSHYQFYVTLADGNEGGDTACLSMERNRTNRRSKPSKWKKKHSWPPDRVNTPFLDIGKVLNMGPKVNATKRKFWASEMQKYFKRVAKVKNPAFEGGFHASVSYIALRRERDGSGDQPRKAPKPPPLAISFEIGIPISKVGDAVSFILERTARIRARDGIFFGVPLGVRYAAASRHYLASNYGRQTAYVEVALHLGGSKNARKHLPSAKRALTEIVRALCDQRGAFKGRPHLGKHHGLTARQIQACYPQFDAWARAFRRFNPAGTFRNDFSDSLGLR